MTCFHALAGAALFLLCGCSGSPGRFPAAESITIAPAEHHARVDERGDPESEAWAIDIARRALEEREDRAAWPYGADYSLIRRSAVQWWVIARRITGHDAAGKPRFEELWDRGIVIDELGDILFYVPAR